MSPYIEKRRASSLVLLAGTPLTIDFDQFNALKLQLRSQKLVNI
jgi:hypothetical protein